MLLSVEEIRKIASLSRLKLTPEEEKRYAETISAVLDYMSILKEVDTKGVEPTSQVTGLEDVYRNDEAVASDLQDKLIKQMPAVEGNELIVPQVFEGSDDEN